MTPAEVVSRRQFIPRAIGGVAALGLAGVVGYELRPSTTNSQAPGPNPTPPTSPITPTVPEAALGNVQGFITRPDLRPPVVKITNVDAASAGGSPRFILITPRNDVTGGLAQEGTMMLDRRGRLVWFKPAATGSDFTFSAGSYGGKPVLTWWEGSVQSAHGYGTSYLADDTYRTIEPIKAGDGLQADLHELTLTTAGTALITAYETRAADLSSLGGPKAGKLFVGHAQEIDLKTGKVLLDWDSTKYVDLAESYELTSQHGGAYDYFHINSIAEMDDGNLLISGRNTWALYKIDRSSGDILWRLGGKKSDFKVDRAAEFYWQHHARAVGTDVITLFDNAVRKEKQSRGLVLSVDTKAMRVSMKNQYLHPTRLDSTALGSVELESDGRVFVGWGDGPYFSEFAPDGALLLDGQLPVGVHSYRAYVQDWVGRPSDPPQIVARANPAGGFIVYASWNGATEIARWTVLAGTDKSSLAAVGSQEWTGFETAIVVNSNGPYFVAVAEDTSGNELGRSATA
jgi:hypothetical protein